MTTTTPGSRSRCRRGARASRRSGSSRSSPRWSRSASWCERFVSEGPTITIIFKSADGIEAGKTFVKYKEVNIGQVTGVRLADDGSNVEVTAKIAKSAANLMVEDAKFWVVRPRISLSGVSGLSTLLSGNYIGFEAGTSKKKERQFTGLEVPPIITGGIARPAVRPAGDATSGSLGIGSPIYYRRLQVGQVVAYDLAQDGKSVRAPHLRQRAVRQVRRTRTRGSGMRAASTCR